MLAPITPPRSSGISGRAFALFVILVVALSTAFVVAPRTLVTSGSGGGGFANESDLVNALRVAFVGYWTSGDRSFSPSMERLVDYWFRYHVAKAVIAAVLLALLVALGVRLWKTFLRASALGAATQTALASAGALVTMLALFALAVVVANVQGAIAPFASLLSMLPTTAPKGEYANTLAQVRQGLAAYPSAGSRTPPALDVMISDYSLYHVAMVVAAAIVAMVFIGMSVMLWKQFARAESSERRTRRTWATFGAVAVALSLAVIVVAIANVTNAADPAPGLLAYFNGGW